jgi:hypothetical protein
VTFITTTQPGWASLRERFQNPFTAFYVHEEAEDMVLGAFGKSCKQAPQIGRIFGLDYGSVNQERRRLRENLPKDRKLQTLICRIEKSLSTFLI